MEGSKPTYGKGNRVLHPQPLSQKSDVGSTAKAREGNRVLHTSKEVGIAYESVRSIVGITLPQSERECPIAFIGFCLPRQECFGSSQSHALLFHGDLRT
jgi:hypothetical protein